MAAELTTVADVKTYLGITASTDDTLLGALLQAAELMLREWCNRKNGWITAAQSERFDGELANTLVLTYTPITVDPVITVTGYGSTSVTVNSDLYRVDVSEGIVVFRLSPIGAFQVGLPTQYWPLSTSPNRAPQPNFGAGNQTVLVTYTGGYANTAAVPLDLAQAAIEATAFLYRQRKYTLGLQSETLDRYSYTLANSGNAPINTLRDDLVNGLLGPYIRRGGYS